MSAPSSRPTPRGSSVFDRLTAGAAPRGRAASAQQQSATPAARTATPRRAGQRAGSTSTNGPPVGPASSRRHTSTSSIGGLQSGHTNDEMPHDASQRSEPVSRGSVAGSVESSSRAAAGLPLVVEPPPAAQPIDQQGSSEAPFSPQGPPPPASDAGSESVDAASFASGEGAAARRRRQQASSSQAGSPPAVSPRARRTPAGATPASGRRRESSVTITPEPEDPFANAAASWSAAVAGKSSPQTATASTTPSRPPPTGGRKRAHSVGSLGDGGGGGVVRPSGGSRRASAAGPTTNAAAAAAAAAGAGGRRHTLATLPPGRGLFDAAADDDTEDESRTPTQRRRSNSAGPRSPLATSPRTSVTAGGDMGDGAASSSSAGAPQKNQPPPPPDPYAPTEAQQKMLDGLEERKATRAAELAQVRSLLRRFELMDRAASATERSDHFNKRAQDVLAENKRLQHEIDELRNSDRLMVRLRDTLDTLKKHLRIRTAHIRQKEATITLIAKRCQGQNTERKKVVESLEADCDNLLAMAVAEDNQTRQITAIQPVRCMAYLLRCDGQDEEHIEAAIRDVEDLKKQEQKATRDLEAEIDRLAVGKEGAEGDKAQRMDAIGAKWEHTKIQMLAELQRLQTVHAELQYHVRRGTHIKTTSNLPDALTWDGGIVRSLMLTLGEEQERLKATQKAHDALAQRAAALPEAFEGVQGAKRDQATVAASLTDQLIDANGAFRERYRELQQAFTGDTSGMVPAEDEVQQFGTPWSKARRGRSTSPAPFGDGGSVVGSSPRRTGDTPGRRRADSPRAFTSEACQRLYEKKTATRKIAEEVMAFENNDRKRRYRQQAMRPSTVTYNL